MLCPIIIILGVCFLGLHYLVGSTSGSSFLLGTCSYTELNKESFEISPHYQSQFLLVLDTSLSMLILIFAGSKTMLEYWIVALINSNHLVTQDLTLSLHHHAFNRPTHFFILHTFWTPKVYINSTPFHYLSFLFKVISPSFLRSNLYLFFLVVCSLAVS